MALAVRMSAEVEEALGPQMAMQARAFTEGTCMECRQPFLDDQLVNVVLGKSTVATAGSIWLAHDGCAPSRIVPLNAEATDALLQPDDGLDMAMTAAMVGSIPVLVAEMVTTPFTTSGTHGAEPRNIYMQSLLQSGFQLVTGELDADPLPEWIAVYQPHGRDLQLIILTPTSEKFFHGILAKPPAGWVQAVRAEHQVLLLGGEIGYSGDADPGDQRAALATAARAGQLAGARIACGSPQHFGLQ